jgi:GPH family glycoside/pentoside/hexuronide:cation symporter
LTGRFEKIAYSIGSIGLTGFLQLMSTYLLFFLVDKVHLDPGLTSLIFLLSYGVWNAINDPIIGYLSDRTRTTWGRRKPYIIAGIPVMLLFSIFIWSPPIGGEPLSNPSSPTVFFYMLLVVALYELGFTMVTVPYGAVYPEMWTDTRDRSEVIIYRESLSVVGGILAMVVFPAIIDSFSAQLGTFRGWAWAGGVMGIIFSGSFLVSLRGIKERREFSAVDRLPRFIASLKTAATNKSWITAEVVCLMTACMIDWVSAMVPFFATHSLGMGVGIIGVMMGAQIAGTFGFFAIWRTICIRYGTKLTMAVSMITFNVGPILGLVVHDVLGVAVMGLVGGITIGGLLLTRKLMIADVIDEDETRTGVRREGVYMGLGAAVSKASLIIVGACTAVLLSTIIGYVPGQPDPALMGMGIRLGLAGFPIIFTILLLVFLAFYPLGTERVAAIRKDLKTIHAAKAETLKKTTPEEA